MNFETLVQKHGLSVEENLSEKVDFFLAKPPYNLRKDPNDDHPEYGVFISSGMKNIEKVYGNVLKPGAHGYMFRSALQLALWYRTAASENKGKLDSTRERSAESGSQCKESESVELRVVSEKENSALHCICTFGNCQQIAVMKHTAHTSVVETGFHF